ncbi:autotransporter domain-containing protein [Herbaspirillum sp. WKF16]|uniref:autotransporter domain-containing protein n=1 Tax=Herbaspirillum sp. WKF16 TaxID=3028312 RepID=UPI0023A9D094|nr:autotransporter domain-containing protein [Herbaspirillum sp. WKF16]WDZ95034.1 autotransporter domain-containing protein [Herbaspirillum sp. WKF16]
MNKIYSLVWNRQQGKFVVAQENATSRGKGSQAARVTGKRAQHAAAAALALTATLLATPASAVNYNVTSTTDNGTTSTNGTLSWAIDQANTGSGNSIFFDLPASSTITLSGTLPTITEAVNLASRNSVQINGRTLVLGSGIIGNVSISNNISFRGLIGTNSFGGFAGNGGIGASVSGDSFTLTNAGNISGGNGGNITGGGFAGNGGDGVFVSGDSFTLTNTGNISGGNSGNVISPSAAGGTAGIGVSVSGNSFTLTNTGNISGGNGGRVDGGGSTTGGNGNIGVSVSGNSFTLTNTGNISGGNGGNVTGPTSASGGNGGIGISGNGITLTNMGNISGGSGGSGGSSGASGSGGVAIVATGSSTIYNNGAIKGGGSANAITLSGGNNKVVLLSGGQFTGNVVSTSGSTAGGDTFALGGDSGSGSFSLADIGTKYQNFAKLAKEGAGAWTLTGTGTSDWTAQGGTLVLADSMNLTGTLAVQSGAAVLANDATVIGAVTNAGSFGVNAGKTATIDSYSGSGTVRIGVAGMTSYGKLVVAGTGNLNGSSLFVDAANATGMSNGTLSDIISAGTLSGTFTSTSTNSLLFSYTPVYGLTNNVSLTVTAVPGNRIFQTTSAQGNFPASGAAKVLDQIIAANANGPISSLFQGFTTGQERRLSNAVSQTLPLFVGGGQVATNSAFSGINRVVQARVGANRGLSSGEEFQGDRNVWFKPFGSWASQGDRNGVSGFSADTYGVVAGIDRPFSEQARAGVAFAYARSSVDSNAAAAPQSSKVDVYQLIGYGSYALDQNTELNFQGDIGRNSNRGKRSIVFASSAADSSYDSTSVHVGAGMARSYALSETASFTTGVRADYTWVRDAGYTESGAGVLNLNVDGRSVSQLVLSTDAKLNLQLNPNTNLAFNAGVGYDTINKQASITSTYAGAPGAAFVTYGLEQSPWIGRVGAALAYTTSGGVDLSLRYDLEGRSSFTNQTASARARWRF